MYDCTDHICPMLQTAATGDWPMYSFDRPSYVVWNAIAKNLHKRGWDEKQIKEWLQSKQARWAMDGKLSEMLESAADAYAAQQIKP